MRSRFLLALLVSFVAVLPVEGQTGTASSKLVFDQSAPDLATAQAYTYGYYPDGATTRSALTVACTGTSSPFTCSAPFPAFTPGAHTLTISATNAAGEGPKSPAFAFTFVVLPSAPTNLRIQ